MTSHLKGVTKRTIRNQIHKTLYEYKMELDTCTQKKLMRDIILNTLKRSITSRLTYKIEFFLILGD